MTEASGGLLRRGLKVRQSRRYAGTVTPAGTTVSMNGTGVNEQLAGALAAEEAAIYAYGTIGVRLTADRDRTEARAAEAAHRNRRDTVVSRLDELSASAAPAPAGYTLPYPVTDRASALRLAVDVEEGVAAAWRVVLPVTVDADRSAALAALTDAAVRATRWRRIAGVTPITVPFPGKPD